MVNYDMPPQVLKNEEKKENKFEKSIESKHAGWVLNKINRFSEDHAFASAIAENFAAWAIAVAAVGGVAESMNSLSSGDVLVTGAGIAGSLAIIVPSLYMAMNKIAERALEREEKLKKRSFHEFTEKLNK